MWGLLGCVDGPCLFEGQFPVENFDQIPLQELISVCIYIQPDSMAVRSWEFLEDSKPGQLAYFNCAEFRGIKLILRQSLPYGIFDTGAKVFETS